MGAQQSINKINFEDVKYALGKEDYIFVNTLPSNKQTCLISGTIHADDETVVLNKYLKENISIKIIVYGENCCDSRVEAKYNQLRSLGFFYVYLYSGGLFEWLLLQDIYGTDVFKTTCEELDHLKYRGVAQFGIKRLTNQYIKITIKFTIKFTIKSMFQSPQLCLPKHQLLYYWLLEYVLMSKY